MVLSARALLHVPVSIPDLGKVTSPGQWAPLVRIQLTTLVVPYPHHLMQPSSSEDDGLLSPVSPTDDSDATMPLALEGPEPAPGLNGNPVHCSCHTQLFYRETGTQLSLSAIQGTTYVDYRSFPHCPLP
jgi:hypothetical protein